MNPYVIRSEKISDYHSIADINAAAFTYSHGMGEVPLISILRNREHYDPELSLVAELDNKIVGHVLFTPLQVCLGERVVDAVLLAPIAIYPDFQNKGIGSLLIEEGHKRAKAKGFQFSLLVGHPSYYPRFGYQTKMWSHSNIRFQLDEIPQLSEPIQERRIAKNDLEQLNSMSEIWNQGIYMSIKPGLSLMDWISPNNGIQSSALEVDGELIGYIRYQKNNPEIVLGILAENNELLVEICAYLKTLLKDKQIEALSLPISPQSLELQKISLAYQQYEHSGPENMLKILNSDNPDIIAYCKEVVEERRLRGNVIWPVEFDIC